MKAGVQTFATKFAYGERVCIDGDRALVAVVTAFQFRTTAASAVLEVSWLHNGEVKTAWVEEWRLSAAD